MDDSNRSSENRFLRIISITVFTIASAISVRANDPVIEAPHVFQKDHNTVRIRWNSETGAIYQVESSDLLVSEGAQELQWVVRASDCVSKGTNAEWMDVGDTGRIPRVLHPFFQNQRFYRVQKVKQADKPAPIVTIQLSQSSPVTTNFIVYVSTTLTDTNQFLSSVGIFVNGQKYFSTARTNFGVWVNSTEWPNGQHEIYAVATTFEGGDIGDTTPVDDNQVETNETGFAVGVSPSLFPVFSNYISQFFVAVPFFQAGQTQEITASFAEDSYWRVRVVDYQDTEVRRFEGQGTSCYADWDGNDQSGFPLFYGFYDYIIEARPSQYGPLGLSALAPSSEASMMPAPSMRTSGNAPIDPVAEFKRTPNAMRFSRGSNEIVENIKIPSLRPTMSAEKSGSLPAGKVPVVTEQDDRFPSSEEEALMAGLTSYYPSRPPLPPVEIDGKTYTWEEVYGPVQPTEIKISIETQEKFLAKVASVLQGGAENEPQENDPQPPSWPDDIYTTRSPYRIPGNMFFGFAGTVGIGYQGHHPKKPPVVGGPEGGVLASAPPWGKLRTVSLLANNFSTAMAAAGWRTSFMLGDDGLNSSNLAPIIPNISSGTFASQCNFGLLAGHMTASKFSDQDFGSFTPYFPVFASRTPTHLQWIALPQMDFGNGSSASHLRWMALYGCQSLIERDYSDLWTKFLLPMPPNLRLLLGSEDGIYICPMFGTRFADNMNGATTGTPMTVFDAWCDAAAEADKIWDNSGWNKLPLVNIGNRHMTAIYRDTSQGGSWNTLNDSIWNWGSDVSVDWLDIQFIKVQVYSP